MMILALSKSPEKLRHSSELELQLELRICVYKADIFARLTWWREKRSEGVASALQSCRSKR
jgi:hypothetical protein